MKNKNENKNGDYVFNPYFGTNFMFFFRGDGTPYDIIYNLVNGNSFLYPMMVFLLFVIYIVGFRAIFSYFRKKKQNKLQTA